MMTGRIALHLLPEGQPALDAGLLRALARAPDALLVGGFGALAPALERQLRGDDFAGTFEHVERGRPQDLARFGTLLHPGPDLARLAWRRLGLGARRYSLCGVVGDIAGHAAMEALAGVPAAPLHGWDALVCNSRVLRDAVRVLLERQAEYLAARFGAQRFELPQLPLIPPGVDCGAAQADEAVRAAARLRFDIAPDDVVFLSFAAPLCRAGDHPQQMFCALERAAKGGRRVHLLLCVDDCGEPETGALRAAAAQLCPSVRLALADGSADGERRAAWAAADVFAVLAEGLHDDGGALVLEAMAAGLPCVAGDWNGRRDIVRDGVDGCLIPTVMPGAGAGLDLARRYDDGIDGYADYRAHISQVVALDGTLLAQACERLVGDSGLRRTLGANARERARREFDWSVVLGHWRALWRELDERRRADPALAPALPQTVPDRLDPFALLATYPSMQIAPVTLVELAPDASLALVRRYHELAINRDASAALPTLEEFGLIFGSIGSRPTQVDELLDALGPCDRPALLRGLAWLCRMDLLRIRAAQMENE